VDVHVPYAIITELRLRGIDVLTAQEDEAGELEHSLLLERSSADLLVKVRSFSPVISTKAADLNSGGPRYTCSEFSGGRFSFGKRKEGTFQGVVSCQSPRERWGGSLTEIQQEHPTV
jgi:hypothetical protein